MLQFDATSRGALTLVVIHVPLPSVLADTCVIRSDLSHEDHLPLEAPGGTPVRKYRRLL